MVKAIARAFSRLDLLEQGTHATIAEIAAAEKINESLYGAFEVKHLFHSILHFLHPSFFGREQTGGRDRIRTLSTVLISTLMISMT